MSMNICVVFAVGIESDNKMYVLDEYLDMLKTNFSGVDIYAGINFSANPNIEEKLENSGLNIKFHRISDVTFHILSDASAYQFALKMMMESGKRYDVVWFVHTKGGHNDRDDIRSLYIKHFFPKRNYIESKFNQLEHLGVFGYRAGHYNWNNETNDKCLGIQNRIIRDIWDGVKTDLFPHTYCKYIIIETMFAMRAEILYKYFARYPEFFDTRINTFPTGRWFIELELCNIIPTRMGYYPVVFFDYHTKFLRTLQFTIDNWIRENQLLHLADYKTRLEDRYEHRN